MGHVKEVSKPTRYFRQQPHKQKEKKKKKPVALMGKRVITIRP